MADDDLNYEDVIDVWEREKEAKLPCTLPNNFYERLRRYIQDLEREVEDIDIPPKDKRGRRIQKQYQRVKKISDLFFKERQKKIVRTAYHRSLGKTIEAENLVDPELDLLEEISTLLDDFRNQVFLGEYKRKTTEVEESGVSDVEEADEAEEEVEQEGVIDTSTEEKEIKSQSRSPQTASKESDSFPDEDRKAEDEELSPDLSPDVEGQDEILVHITQDVPSFVDIDATYDLEKEDVLTLREDLAKVLIERDKARKIKL